MCLCWEAAEDVEQDLIDRDLLCDVWSDRIGHTGDVRSFSINCRPCDETSRNDDDDDDEDNPSLSRVLVVRELVSLRVTGDEDRGIPSRSWVPKDDAFATHFMREAGRRRRLASSLPYSWMP